MNKKIPKFNPCCNHPDIRVVFDGFKYYRVQCGFCGKRKGWYGAEFMAVTDWNWNPIKDDLKKDIFYAQSRIQELEEASQNLIDEVKRRYPNEELRCKYMIDLDNLLRGKDNE